MSVQQECIAAYRQHKNLKIVGEELGLPWQKVYVHLRNAGEPVTGDKLRYGSDTDRLAAKAEQIFLKTVPEAVSLNEKQYQAKIDFQVNGYGVDVKVSRLKLGHQKCKVRRWAFCLKKQEASADFFVCMCLDESGDSLDRVLLVPGEIARRYQTLSLSERGGKWSDYEIDRSDIRDFFLSLPVNH